MVDIMKALYYGRVIPWERRVVMTDERKKVEKSIEREKQYFAESMSTADRERFERLGNLCVSASCYEDVDIYSNGFTLGALLMLEVLENAESIISE